MGLPKRNARWPMAGAQPSTPVRTRPSGPRQKPANDNQPIPANDNEVVVPIIDVFREVGLPRVMPRTPFRPAHPWQVVAREFLPQLQEELFPVPKVGPARLTGWTFFRASGHPGPINWQSASTRGTVERFWWIDMQAGGEPLGTAIPQQADGLFLAYYNALSQRWASVQTFYRDVAGTDPIDGTYSPGLAGRPNYAPLGEPVPVPRTSPWRDAAAVPSSPWPEGYVSGQPTSPAFGPAPGAYGYPALPGLAITSPSPFSVPGPSPTGRARPSPGPATAPLPYSPPALRPPRAGETERKPKVRGNAAAVKVAAEAIMNAATESMDFIRAVWTALPRQYRSRLNKNMSGSEIGYRMLQDIYRHYDKVDLGAALTNIITNQVQDYVIGKTNDVANKRFLEANKKVGLVSPVGLGTRSPNLGF